MIEYVDIATARDAKGVRIVAPSIVPSPWSEAAKGLFRVGGIPVLVVRTAPRNPEIKAWTGIDNVPVVLHDVEPVRSTWSGIVGLAARLAPSLLPAAPAERAAAMGLIELIAGEDGLGWNARLAMIHASKASNGERGFPPPAATYLAQRYGYDGNDVRDRVKAQLAHLADRLGGADYFGGTKPNAIDIYAATFLVPYVRLAAGDCPAISPAVHLAFTAAADELGPLVPASLLALRARMFERHLGWPIVL